MKSKSKKLISNTILFFIGSIGSKLIQFILVPLYTYTLTKNEFGTTDLVLTTINFLIPFFSIQISDGLLRFGLDKKEKQDDVINSSFKILICGSLLSILLIPLFSLSEILKNWILYFLVIMNLRMYRDLLSIVLKIKDMNKLFAIDSILYTFVLCISSVLCLVVFKLGISGYFISYIIANIFSIFFIIIVSKIKLKKLFRKIDKKLYKKLILYSLPLIINSLSYWITTAFDRYMINWILDKENVGLYAVAAKIPTILSTFTGIFSQAWLISSINEYETERDNKFYSETFINYCQISMVVCAILIFFINPFMKIYVSGEYYEAWIYSPLLILSAVFSGVCSFLNGIYYAYKKNISTTITTIVGAILNIILNLLLIPKIGVMGATIATVISWFVIMLLKLKHLYSFIKLKVQYVHFIISTLLIIFEIFALFLDNVYAKYTINLILTLIIVTLNYQIILKLGDILKAKLRKKKVNQS